MKYCLIRIIGNELPPRDTKGGRSTALGYILEHEPEFPDCQKLWLINQIHSPDHLEEIISILCAHGQQYQVLPFDSQGYIRSKTEDERIVNAININKARNIALDVSAGRFTFVFDGDCFFTDELWQDTTKELVKDQIENPERQYYVVPMVRVTNYMPREFRSLQPNEPQLIFRDDATLRFDERIPFSKNDKIELLKRLGYIWKNQRVASEGSLCRAVGLTIHMHFGDEKTEKDLRHRMDVRQQSIDILLKKLDAMYL
jgi:hypothetical protein